MFCQSLTRCACEVLPYRSHLAAKKVRKTELQQKEHTEEELERQRHQLEQQQNRYQEQLLFDDFSAAVGGEEGLQEVHRERAAKPESASSAGASGDGAAPVAAFLEDDGDVEDDEIAAPSQQEAVDLMRRVLGLAEIMGRRVGRGCCRYLNSKFELILN